MVITPCFRTVASSAAFQSTTVCSFVTHWQVCASQSLGVMHRTSHQIFPITYEYGYYSTLVENAPRFTFVTPLVWPGKYFSKRPPAVPPRTSSAGKLRSFVVNR